MPPRKKPAARKTAAKKRKAPEPEPEAVEPEAVEDNEGAVLDTSEADLKARFASTKTATEYAQFHGWVERCLEAARADLSGALFPVFAHCYCALVDEGNNDEASRFLERWAPSHDDRYASYVESLRRASSKASSKRDPFRKRLAKSKFKVCLGKAARDLLGDFLIRSEHTAVLRILNNFVEVEEEGLKGVARLVDEDVVLTEVALGVPTRSELETPSGLNVPDFSTPYGASLLRDACRRPLQSQTEAGLVSRGRGPLDALKPTVLGLCIVGGDAQRLSCVQGSDDTTRCIAGFADSTVRIWRPDAVEEDDKNRRPSKPLAAHVGGVSSVSWAGGSRYALSSGNDGAVVLWDADAPNDEGEGAPLQRYAAHADACWSVHSPSSSDALGGGRIFATGGADRTCRLFSTDRTRPLRIFAGHWSDVTSVKIHPNAHSILSCSRDATCRLWDVRVDGGGPLCARVLDAASSELVRCDISTDGASACAVSTNGMLHVWDLASGRTTASIEAHAGCAYACAFSACGAAIATCGRDGSLKVWDVALLQAKGPAPAPAFSSSTSDRPVLDVRWTPGNLLLAGGALLE